MSDLAHRLLDLPGQSWVKYSPWEQEGYCDSPGRCWFRNEHQQSWHLAHPGEVANVIACLPFYVSPPHASESD